MKSFTREDIASLSPSERLTLIGDLWDSLDCAAPPLPDSQRREVERRLASFDQDVAEAMTWDQLKTELAARASGLAGAALIP